MAMGGASGGGEGEGPTTLAEINVTPLVDVMLVLLIIFMVTASVETVRVEQELERSRVERDLVPRKPEEPKNPLKDVPVIVPNTQVKEVQETEQKEPKVVLAADLAFYLDDTKVLDCKGIAPGLKNLAPGSDPEEAGRLFEPCAQKAAAIFGQNALIQDKKRVNFAADREIPWGFATRFMAAMGVQHGIKQVNVVVTAPPSEPAAEDAP